MLDFKGNTAVYLISYVRLASILNKCGLDEKSFQSLVTKGFKITHPFERHLIIDEQKSQVKINSDNNMNNWLG